MLGPLVVPPPERLVVVFLTLLCSIIQHFCVTFLKCEELKHVGVLIIKELYLHQSAIRNNLHRQENLTGWRTVRRTEKPLSCWLVGCIEDLRRFSGIYISAQPYRDLKAGDNQSLKFWESNPGPLAPHAKSFIPLDHRRSLERFAGWTTDR